MTKEEALTKLLASKNYKDFCPDTVKSEFEKQLAKRGSVAEAEKYTRERLHAMSGAFMSAGELKAARKCLARFIEGDEAALHEALLLHASSRERIDVLSTLYEEIFSVTGRPDSVLDAACGLNPLYLGSLGIPHITATDLHGALTDLISDWAQAAHRDIHAYCSDLTLTVPKGKYDLCLLMKLLPVLETNEKGSAMKLLSMIDARFFCVTFPTRTLGGRRVNMEESYSQWFEANLPACFTVKKRFTLGSELIYVLEKTEETV